MNDYYIYILIIHIRITENPLKTLPRIKRRRRGVAVNLERPMDLKKPDLDADLGPNLDAQVELPRGPLHPQIPGHGPVYRSILSLQIQVHERHVPPPLIKRVHIIHRQLRILVQHAHINPIIVQRYSPVGIVGPKHEVELGV